MRAAGGSQLRAALAAAVRNKATAVARCRTTDTSGASSIMNVTTEQEVVGQSGKAIVSVSAKVLPMTGYGCDTKDESTYNETANSDRQQINQMPTLVLGRCHRDWGDASYEVAATKTQAFLDTVFLILSNYFSRRSSFLRMNGCFSRWSTCVMKSIFNRRRIAQMRNNRRRSYLGLNFKMWMLLKQNRKKRGRLQKLSLYLLQRSSLHLSERSISEWRLRVCKEFQRSGVSPPDSVKIATLCAPLETLMVSNGLSKRNLHRCCCQKLAQKCLGLEYSQNLKDCDDFQGTVEQGLARLADATDKQLISTLSVLEECDAQANVHLYTKNRMIEALDSRYRKFLRFFRKNRCYTIHLLVQFTIYISCTGFGNC